MSPKPAKISLSHRVLRGWRLCLAGMLVLVALLTTPGCHKLFGDFEVTKSTVGMPSPCSQGDLRCNEEYLLSCKASEDGWELNNTCATPDQCDSRSGGCQVCTPRDLRCNGANREACEEDGSGWTVIDTCESEAMCNPSSCGLCPNPGDLDCAASGNSIVLRQCVQGTGWYVIDADCATERLCDLTVSVATTDPANWMGECLDPVCPEAGALTCDGATLRRCPQTLDTWMQVDICDTEALCQQTLDSVTSNAEGAVLEMCNAGCSPAGGFFCDGQDLQRCRDDQTGWELKETCPEGRTCNPTLGECSGPCAPGEFRCNGANLEACGDDQEWAILETCATQALCSTAQDANTLEWTGACETPVCGVDEHKCEGAELWRCNADRTEFLLDETCATAALCESENKRCRTPVCGAGERRCNPADPLTLEECKTDRTAYDPIETCAADEACNPTGDGPNCLKDCPATPVRCLGAVRELCSDDSGRPLWYPDATCATQDLCNCVLNGTCTQLTTDMKCGQAICGLNLPDFNCNGSVLQQCDSGRNTWSAQKDCGSSSLCDTGTNGDNGACLACPTAGEVQCFTNTSGEARRTCAPDRSQWRNVQNCGFGCVDSGASDYCAVCFSNELRCDSGGDLDRCTAGRDALIDEQDCQFNCLLNGNTDQCAACAANESRCNGATKRQTCDTDQLGLSLAETCTYSCIDDDLSDFCGTCQANDKQCSGDVLQTCAGGLWGSDQTCMFACIPVSGGPDKCAPDCAPGVDECVSSATAVRSCSANGTWGTAASCPFSCINNGTNDFCAPECMPGTTECISTTQFKTCNAQGVWVSQPTNCGAPTGACYQGACVQCNPDSYVDNCTSGTNLRTCSSTGAIVNTTCSGATPACAVVSGAAGCNECAPGDKECEDADTLNTCGDTGTWSSADCPDVCAENNGVTKCFECDGPAFECVNTTDFRTCSESTGTWSMTNTCPNLANCSESLQDCEECQDNGKRCTANNTKIQACSSGVWQSAADCPGMVDCIGTYPNADCGVCQTGDLQCSGNKVQECMSGAWMDLMTCPALCRTGECVDCKADTHFMCDGTSDIFACDVPAGEWETTSMSCSGFDCYGTEPGAYCGECNPGDTSCNGNELLTCGSGGLWPLAGSGYDCGSTYGCFPGAGDAYCGKCTPGDEACSASQESDCNAGLWVPGMSCGGNSCDNDRCGECADGDTACATATTLDVCSAGVWGTTNCAMMMQVCATVSGSDGCHVCDPGDTTCADDIGTFLGSETACDTDGTWGSAMACSSVSCAGDSCGACLNDDQECRTNNNGQIRICANGAWGGWMDCADANGCSGNDCAPPSGVGGTGGMGGMGGMGGSGMGGSSMGGATTTMGGAGGVGGATSTTS